MTNKFYPCQHIARTIPVTTLISFNDALGLLSVSRSTLYRWINAQKLPSPIVIDKKIQGWRADDFEQFLQHL